jgi:hypothetical protein
MAHVPRAELISTLTAGPDAGKENAFHKADRPFPLERIVLEASGQVLIDVPARYLQHFGKRQDGVQRYAGTLLQDDVAAYVYKIALGFQVTSSGLIIDSVFAELSNRRLTV